MTSFRKEANETDASFVFKDTSSTLAARVSPCAEVTGGLSHLRTRRGADGPWELKEGFSLRGEGRAAWLWSPTRTRR